MPKTELIIVLSALAAVTVHELGHIIAMKLLGIKHTSVTPRFFGLGINADFSRVSYTKEIIVCVSGSVSNFILALFTLNFPVLAFSAAAYGIFNLLPVSFLDGGEILKLLLKTADVPDAAAFRICDFCTTAVTVVLWIISVYLAVIGAGTAMLITALYMVVMGQLGKKT